MSTPAQAQLDEVKLAMQKVAAIFNGEVIAKRNFSALDQVYTSDARILPPGAPMISGRAAIKDFWKNLIQSVNAKSAALTTVDIITAGDGLVEIGSATITMSPDGQNTSEMQAKYVVFWRQEDSAWKWHVDIWNADS